MDVPTACCFLGLDNLAFHHHTVIMGNSGHFAVEDGRVMDHSAAVNQLVGLC